MHCTLVWYRKQSTVNWSLCRINWSFIVLNIEFPSREVLPISACCTQLLAYFSAVTSWLRYDMIFMLTGSKGCLCRVEAFFSFHSQLQFRSEWVGCILFPYFQISCFSFLILVSLFSFLILVFAFLFPHFSFRILVSAVSSNREWVGCILMRPSFIAALPLPPAWAQKHSDYHHSHLILSFIF